MRIVRPTFGVTDILIGGSLQISMQKLSCVLSICVEASAISVSALYSHVINGKVWRGKNASPFTERLLVPSLRYWV